MMDFPDQARVPVIGFIAPSGTGKTTLLRYVIGLLRERGLRIGVVKQARSDFDVDIPGKDSYQLRKAGIERLLLGSERQSALILEHKPAVEPDLNESLRLFDQQTLDIILVEGFSETAYPKIELYRQEVSTSPRYPYDRSVIAVATDVSQLDTSLPLIDINNPWQVSDFVVDLINKRIPR